MYADLGLLHSTALTSLPYSLVATIHASGASNDIVVMGGRSSVGTLGSAMRRLGCFSRGLFGFAVLRRRGRKVVGAHCMSVLGV